MLPQVDCYLKELRRTPDEGTTGPRGKTRWSHLSSAGDSLPPPPLALCQHVNDRTAEDRAGRRVHDCQGLEAQRVERVAKHVDSVVVVAEREVLRPNLGIRAAQVDLAAVAGVDVAEVVHGRHRDLEA